MQTMDRVRSWLIAKLNEPCACGSEENYRLCCLRKESAYLLIGVVSAAVLFFFHRSSYVIAVPVVILAAYAANRVRKYYRTKRERDKDRKT